MSASPGMLRYNTDNGYFERSTDEGTSWAELSLQGVTKGPAAYSQTITTTGVSTSIQLLSRVTDLVCNNASLLTLQSILPLVGTGDILYISSKNAQVDIPHLSGSGTAGYKFSNFATVGITSLAAGSGTTIYIYEGPVGSGFWRLITHQQGAWITPAYSSGDYAAQSAMTWGVGSGDVVDFRFKLEGKKLIIKWTLVATTVGGTPASYLTFTVPNGYTGIGEAHNVHTYKDNASAYGIGQVYFKASVSATLIRLYLAGFGSATWAAATNATETYGQVEIEVN